MAPPKMNFQSGFLNDTSDLDESKLDDSLRSFMDKGETVFESEEGRADVIKDKTVYELKFVTELNHEHFLQCACYAAALHLKKGILWNVQNNEMYEISIPDKKKFLDEVVNTITKGAVKEYKR